MARRNNGFGETEAARHRIEKIVNHQYSVRWVE